MKITDFYSQVSAIVNDYTNGTTSLDKATTLLDELNEKAIENNLKVSVDLNIFNNIDIKKEEIEEEDDDSSVDEDDDSSVDESLEEEDDDESYSYEDDSYSYED